MKTKTTPTIFFKKYISIAFVGVNLMSLSNQIKAKPCHVAHALS